MIQRLFRRGWRYETPPAGVDAPPELTVGALSYSVAGLMLTLGLLLCGSAGYFINIQLVSNLLPRQLNMLGADNATIGLVITTIPCVVTMICNPAISFWSDRLRTRFGRRRLPLLVSTPLISLLLILIGWSAPLAAVLKISPLLLLSALITINTIIFMVPGALLWYLFPDVVPGAYMARYMALFQVVGSLTGIVFGRWLMPYAINALPWLYTAVAVAYLLSMLLMIGLVREGQYPAPPRENVGNPLKALKVYFVECYGIGFYYWFYIAMALSDVSIICRGMFNLLYAEKTLHISPEHYGMILSYGAVAGLIISVPCGWLSDKIHPMRFFALSLLTVVTVNVFSFWGVTDEWSFTVSSIALAVVYTMQGVSTIPVFVEILPKDFYGQFSSANALFRSIFMAVCGYGGGLLFDALDNYQYIYAWDFIFTLWSLICFGILYRLWRKRGGPGHYQPPLYGEVHPGSNKC